MASGKVVLIGTGSVGSSYAYSLLNQTLVDELILIDVNEKRAEAEVMDLNHGMYFVDSPVKIKRGIYEDCKDADIVCVTAGVSQQRDASRLDFAEANTKIFKTVIENVMNTGFNGIFIIATNPVDIMTHVTWKFSKFPQHKIIGSGTILDTSRYCYMLGEYFNINPHEINGYIIGEHGDSQVAALSTTYIGSRSILDIVKSNKDMHIKDLELISQNVRDAAQTILEGKNATHYGIGLGLARLTKAVLRNENSILPVSTYLDGEYGYSDLFFGVPSVINRQGVSKIIELDLNNDEKTKLEKSVQVIRNSLSSINL